jgi:hypothetical protein
MSRIADHAEHPFVSAPAIRDASPEQDAASLAVLRLGQLRFANGEPVPHSCLGAPGPGKSRSILPASTGLPWLVAAMQAV